MVLSGTVAQFSEAFNVTLRRFEHPNGAYRGRTGPIHVPPELDGVIQAVLGLDNRRQAGPHIRIPAGHRNVLINSAAANDTAPAGFLPTQLAELYNFPAGDGAGQCVGIIELGGGYRPADLATFFADSGISPAPSVVALSVDGAQNAPVGNPNSADGEVLLDIEVVGGVAPGASIAVYFAPNTDAGFADAVLAAVHDTVNKPSVISISWGGPEANWTSQGMTALDDALQAAVLMGVTVTVASGDNGSSDSLSGDNADFPASSPHALACGGTTLVGSGNTITSESVWNEQATGGGASGGGVSTVFPVPAWQAGLTATMTSGATAPLAFRGVPDVCGDADPATGYQIVVDGETLVFGGTSAVAPLWAALLARIIATSGQPVGLVQPLLYGTPAALNDITAGDNGDFAATAGWDACSGLGSPNGNRRRRCARRVEPPHAFTHPGGIALLR